jgi:glycosyltransferase involved in cell wall biosynthesis
MRMRTRPRIGIFDHLSANRGGSQLVVARMAAELARDFSVEIIHGGAGYTLADLGHIFGVDLSRVRERIVPDVPDSFAVPGQRSFLSYLTEGLDFDRALTAPYALFVYSGHGIPPVSHAGAGIIYCHFPFEGRPRADAPPAERRRRALGRWARVRCYEWLWARRMRTYRAVFANSKFTASWIERSWGTRPEVLYPPVAAEARPGQKRNMIVSVGRFDGRDRKNLGAQLRAFPKFLAETDEEWTLCLMGFCRDSPRDRDQVEALRQQASGLPVTFLVNAERDVILSSLSEAKMFWHTRGLDEDGEDRIPPRFMEHFGIATVEAMMAGCVPFVPANGGQPEIVEHGVSGMLCADAQALVEASIRLARDPDSLDHMSQRARERSHAFRAGIFDHRVSEIARSLVRS